MTPYGTKSLPREVLARLKVDPLVTGALNQANCTDGGEALDLPSKRQIANLVLSSLQTQGEASPFYSYKDYFLVDLSDAIHTLWKSTMQKRKRYVVDESGSQVSFYYTEFKRHMVPPPLGRTRQGQFTTAGPAGPGRGHRAVPLRMPLSTSTPSWQHVSRVRYFPFDESTLSEADRAWFKAQERWLCTLNKTKLNQLFIRRKETDNHIEHEGRVYTYLSSSMVQAVTGQAYGERTRVMSTSDIELLEDPANWVADESGDYLPGKVNKTTITLRNRVMDIIKGFCARRGVMGEARQLMRATEDPVALEQCGDVPLPCRNMFLRYYSPLPENPTTNEAKFSNNAYPPHADQAALTIIMTLPTKNYCKDGGMALKFYDSRMQKVPEWKEALDDRDELEGICARYDEEGTYEMHAIHGWEFAVMRSPCVHRVTQILKGDRMSVIIFLGVDN